MDILKTWVDLTHMSYTIYVYEEHIRTSRYTMFHLKSNEDVSFY